MAILRVADTLSGGKVNLSTAPNLPANNNVCRNGGIASEATGEFGDSCVQCFLACNRLTTVSDLNTLKTLFRVSSVLLGL